VQLLTLPATKLLEFERMGKIQEPAWRPVNAPMNILRLFRGEESPDAPAEDL